MQVTHTYNRSLQRNDASLMKYGFIQGADPPRLCGVDLPGGQLGEVYEGDRWEPVPHSALASREEMQRLSDTLAAFPTTAEEDAALLAGTPYVGFTSGEDGAGMVSAYACRACR